MAVILADPTKFEADILVNEIDILKIRLGALASIQVDAMQGISFPATVTRIVPTAIVQAGVVNYKVKVELESLTPSDRPEQQEEGREIALEALYEKLEAAVEVGRISQEQADKMKEYLKQRLETGQQPGGLLLGAIQLREGLSVTVSVVIWERNDVIIVPNRAIIHQGQETLVQVLENGVIEQRSVTTGLSDWQYTEITEGLSEGEKVVVTGTGTTTTTPTTPQPGGKMPFFPGKR